ncbi:MAG TPA: polysaccharide biosynthesis tyrosine autokinase, partial [Actinomycetota bacterium]|nr:polysaccharide biosynthesis tyrosine autokinase [Actinomycetota bacterium]
SPTTSPTETIPEQGAELTSEQIRAGQIFLRGVQVQPSRQSSTLLNVRVANADPRKATKKAVALGLAYLGFKHSEALAAGAQAKANLQAQIADKQAELAEAEATAEQDTTGRASGGVAQLEQDLGALQFQLQQLKQAITEATGAGDIINPTLPSRKPVRPNHIRDALFAIIVGMVLGLGAAFLRDYLDDSLKGTEDVERQSGAALIGVVPHVQAAGRQIEARNGDRERSYLVTLDDPKAPSSEAYRTLRTNLLFMSVSGPVGRLLITSPVAGEGKSTTAANLAVVLAQAGQRVLLVGSDLRRPSVHRFFGVSNRVGLSSVLVGQASLMEAVADPGIKGLRVMSGGPVPPNPTELLGSLAMKDFLDQAAQVTDWVLLDAPPVLGLADAAVLATLSDAALLVVNEATSRRVLAHARDQLAKVEARVVGTILNNFGPSFSYYYSDYYAYTSQYYLAPETQQNGKLSRKDRRRQRKAEETAGRGAGLAFEEEEKPQPVGQRSARSAEDFWNENPT